jgi:Phytanoyl-CoA dioxygenase (PhyH)
MKITASALSLNVEDIINSTSDLPGAFRTFGFGVLRQFFDPYPLAVEIDRVMYDGLVTDHSTLGEIHFQYVPMMTAKTPVSLSLLDRIEAVAAGLLGGSVLPTRAKGVRYSGNTPWHTDSASPLASIGFLAYLEPLRGEDGALRVLPGSHHPDFRDALCALGINGVADVSLPAQVVVTEPGDLLLLNEHLFHASFGGGIRRQWRVDFVQAPLDADAERITQSYFADIYPPDWDGGYDVDRYPTYGLDWRNSSRPSAAQLDALGVYELASAQEAFTRTRRRSVSESQ